MSTPDLSNIRGILFDLWGTLAYNVPRHHRKDYDLLASKFGVHSEDLWKKWVIYGKPSIRGQIKSGEERAALVLKDLGLTPSPEMVKELAHFEYENRSADVYFFPGVEDMLATLRERGYRTCLISNCNYLTSSVVERLNLANLMDGIILSCEVGLAKPDLAIYRMGAERLGLATGDCLFAGDGGDGELDGAKAAGCKLALVAQERGHAFRFPAKNYPYDIRLNNINELVNYLKQAPIDSSAA
ncbi:MAG TPA: HAD family hydrolase [Chloroflexia bacterium]|nr:HAD family hydrolase [Chloroflexia bacterium]